MAAAGVVYGALWALLDVAYLAHRFPLPFLTGMPFYRRYSHIVGGPAQYAASLFSQTFTRHWAGALAFTLLAVAAWAIARGIFRRFSAGSWNWPAAAFPALILILASRDLAVLFVLPMVAGLAAAWLYMILVARASRPRRAGETPAPQGSDAQHDRWPSWVEPAVVSLFLIASIPLHVLLASGFLYLCVIAALFEWLVRKRPAWSLAWLVAGAAVPYAMSAVYYEPDVVSRYLRWVRLPQFDALTVTNGLVAAMYLFAPVGAVVAFATSRLAVGARLAPRVRLSARVAGFAVLVLLASRLVAIRLDSSGWVYADYLVDDGRPDEALTSLAQASDVGDASRFLTFYALARTGRLPWEMFHYPQLASSDDLLLRDPMFDRVPGIADWRSDVYLELGRVNEAQRWAHEALAVEGETPRVLERMALVYILNDNAEAARTFIRALEKVPFQGARARQYLAALDRDPGMRDDPLVARVKPLMLHADYVGTWSTEQILLQCLDANPSNRTAFEYLLAHYLLTSDMKGLASLAPRLKDFYRVLPTHVQEALVGYRNTNGSLPPGIDPSAIDRETEARFQRFVNLWVQYQNGSVEAAWKALAPDFGDTWWFFFIFDRTLAGPPFQARTDAAPKGTAGGAR